MGKTIVFFKKIGDTKGTFHAKMGTIKDRNCMDLTEAEDIKKRWQEYTEELYKKDLHNPDNHEGVTTHTHLELDILECEVKSSFGRITMNKPSMDLTEAEDIKKRWQSDTEELYKKDPDNHNGVITHTHLE